MAKQSIHGVVLLDKAPGISSNKALQQVRFLYNAKKAGHTGSLDPIATGLLPICLGQATKLCSYLLGSTKSYQAIIKLGEVTDTYDREGQIIQTRPVNVTQDQLEDALAQFRGEIEQVPPMYSALKKDGQPLYKLARQGKEIERSARSMFVEKLESRLLDNDLVQLDVRCSSGFYVRSLAFDLGEALGCGAHIQELRRTEIRDIGLASAQSFAQLESLENSDQALPLLPLDYLLDHLPVLDLDEEQHQKLFHGIRCNLTDKEAGKYRLYRPDGQIFAVGIIDQQGLLKTEKVFVLD